MRDWPTGMGYRFRSQDSEQKRALANGTHLVSLIWDLLRKGLLRGAGSGCTGDFWGTWLLLPFQITIFVGVPIAYAVAGGQSLHKVTTPP